jgi:hypothetical protein
LSYTSILPIHPIWMSRNSMNLIRYFFSWFDTRISLEGPKIFCSGQSFEMNGQQTYIRGSSSFCWMNERLSLSLYLYVEREKHIDSLLFFFDVLIPWLALETIPWRSQIGPMWATNWPQILWRSSFSLDSLTSPRNSGGNPHLVAPPSLRYYYYYYIKCLWFCGGFMRCQRPLAILDIIMCKVDASNIGNHWRKREKSINKNAITML